MSQDTDDVLGSLSDGLLIIDRDYTIIYANDRVAELSGRPAGGVIGKKCHAVFHASPVPCEQGSLCSHREVFSKERPVTLKHHHLLPDGSSRIIEISATPLRNEKGTVDRLVQVLRDITEEEKLRGELAASHQTLEAIFSNAPFAISFIDTEMRVIRLNPVMEALVGFKTEEARGKHCYDCWGQYSRDAGRSGRERICDACQVSAAWLDGKKHCYERRAGDRIVEVVTSPVRDADGAIIGAMEMGYDITERRQAEDKLRESEERMRLIAETVTEAFWMSDVAIDKNFYISPAYEHIWGRSLQSLRDNPRSFLEAIHPDDLAHVLANFELKKTEQPFDLEYRICRPDGTLRWIWDRGFPVHEPSGEVFRYVGVAQDITERHEVHAALQESENRYRALFESSPNVLCIADFSGIRQFLADPAPGCGDDYETFFRENPRELGACLSRMRISSVNQAALDLSGAVSQQELIEGLFTVIGPEAVPQTAGGVSAVGRGEISFGHEIVLHHLLTGAKIHCILRWNVVPGYEESYQQVILSLTDISARKSAEDTLADQRTQLRRLSARLVETEEGERRRLAGELHDKLGQQLTALGLSLNIFEQSLPPKQGLKQRKRIADMLQLVEEMTEQVRDIMADLRPPVLDDYGLSAALRWYGAIFGKRSGIACVLKGTDIPRLPAQVEITLFRVVQEALTNVAKHSKASRVEIRSALEGDRLSLVVHDNGGGFPEADDSEMPETLKLGLISMGERIASVGGTLAVTSAPETGTIVSVEVGL